MAGKATLVIDITADTAAAIGNIDKTTGAVKSYGDAASTAAKQSRDIGGSIESTGSVAGDATTGLRDLGGAMSEMGGTVGTMGSAMVQASTVFEAMEGATTLYAVAQTVASTAAKGFTKAMNLMKVSILTNPIFIIAAIIIGIGVALVIAYNKSATFRRIVDGAFRAVATAVKTVWTWIRTNWPLLLAILTGPIGLAVLAITRNWDKIKAGAQTVWTWINRNWAKIKGWLTAPFTAAWDVISGIFDRIVGAIENAVGWIGRLKFPSPPSWLSAIVPGSFAAAPPVAGTRAAPAAATRAAPAGITVNVTGALDPEGVARQIRRILESSDRRGGRTGVLRPVGTV